MITRIRHKKAPYSSCIMSNHPVQTGIFCDPALAKHRNSSQLFTMIVVVSGINIALSLTATLGNALILAALNRESFLNPPSKLLLRCLAFSDLFVGLILQPVAAISRLSAVYHCWNLCQVSELLWHVFGIMMASFSLATLTAISVDRLLALLLGIRYRQVVTMKRARFLDVLFLLISIVNCVLLYTDIFAFFVYSVLMWFVWLTLSVYCYVRIYLVLRNHIQTQVTPQGQPNGISPLNLSQYKKTVSSAMWLFAAMMICYFPMGLVLIYRTAVLKRNASVEMINDFAITLVYLNSSLNPVLYCWKLKEVRHAVREILRNSGLYKLCLQ